MRLTGTDALNGRLVELVIENQTIVERRELPEKLDPADEGASNIFFSPGWIDLQVNGWKGRDYNGDNLDADSFKEICRDLAASGTTRHLPTVITASESDMLRRIATIRRLRDESPWLKRRVPGIHIEGPFLSGTEGPRGAHNPDHIRDPSIDEFDAWQDAAGGLIRIVTLAPERRGSLEFIRELSSRGVLVSLGHSEADPQRIREAIAAGARMSTHLGNGLSNTINRYENPLWEQLASDKLTVSLISDGHHLPAAFIKTAFRAKGTGSIVLVSDAASPGGSAPGITNWAGIDVEVNADGRISLAGTPYLAGAGHLQNRGVGIFLDSTDCRIEEAIAACTTTPAALLGLEENSPGDVTVFRVKPGKKPGSRHIDIKNVWLDGSVDIDSEI